MLLRVILRGRQVHFQYSHFLLELGFSPQKSRCALNRTPSLYLKCYVFALYKVSECCFSLTPTYLYAFVFFSKVQSCHVSFLFFLRCCWWSPFYKKGLSTLLLHNDDGLSLHGLHPLNVRFSCFPVLWGFSSFHGNTDVT